MAEDKDQQVEQENPLAKRGVGRPKAVEAKDSDDQIVTLSVKELRALIAETKAGDQESLAKTITNTFADALRDLRKPYVDPAQKENNDKQAAQMRQLHDRMKRNLEIDRTNCAHLQGSNALSEEQGTRLSIAWHKLDTQTWWGICTNCQREFWPSDPDYRQWRAKKSGNRSSQAGQRDFVDQKAWEDQEHPVPFGSSLPAIR